MAANVSNSLPYKPIEPLPEPIQRCPELRLGLIRTTFVAATIGICAGAGATFCLGTMAFSVLTGAIAGGVIGLVMGVFFSVLIRFPTVLASYRVATLEQMEKTFTDKRVLESIKTLKTFFSQPLRELGQTYHNHLLHNEITLITEKVDRQRPDIVKVWRTFLNHLHGRVVLKPDGEEIKLDFSMELKLLDTGKKVNIHPSWLDLKSPQVDQDLAVLEDIQRESFGKVGTFSAKAMKETLLSDPRNRCILVRGENQEILGFAWMIAHEEGMSISGVARRPGAARVAIGDQLLGNIVKAAPPNEKVYLHVRMSNPAKSLYEKWGFEVVATLPHYYTFGPAEGAHKMVLNRSKFEEAFKKFSRRS